MKHVVRCMILLVGIGLAAVPAFAAELRVTGFIDNVFPRWDKNLSSVDQDPTRAGDEIFLGRTRNRTFFNFIASDDLRGVFAIEIDQSYGAPQNDRLGSGCVEGEGTFAAEQCGFRNGTDTNSIEVKHLFVDFRVPQLPIGNRWRLGGLPFNLTPLHSPTLYTMDAGGGDVRLNFTDQVSLLMYYVQLEEDLDRFPGSAKIGEDYITGLRVELKPIPGLDFHILGTYNHGQAPFGPALTGGGGPFNNIASDVLNVRTESRYYLGFDSRYRIGNTSIEPGFLYLLGSRKFSSASAALTGVSDTDFNAFQAFIIAQHTAGPWLFAGKFAYASGDDANADLNNRGIGNRSDVKGFRTIGVDTSHFFGEWFEVLGKSDVDGVGDRDFRRMGEVSKLDRFGWMIIGGKAEYKYADNLVLEGAAGGFWTAEKTGCPATFRVGSTSGPCTGPGVPRTVGTNEPALNFTGNSRFVGWEVDVGLRYTIMPGLTWTPRMGYADYGSALDINNRKAQDAWVVVNRMIYIF
ncbi:MAG: hypothetical protein ACRERE_17145 [Candidatus Entotheonellia bacterium]